MWTLNFLVNISSDFSTYISTHIRDNCFRAYTYRTSEKMICRKVIQSLPAFKKQILVGCVVLYNRRISQHDAKTGKAWVSVFVRTELPKNRICMTFDPDEIGGASCFDYPCPMTIAHVIYVYVFMALTNLWDTTSRNHYITFVPHCINVLLWKNVYFTYIYQRTYIT